MTVSQHRANTHGFPVENYSEYGGVYQRVSLLAFKYIFPLKSTLALILRDCVGGYEGMDLEQMGACITSEPLRRSMSVVPGETNEATIQRIYSVWIVLDAPIGLRGPIQAARPSWSVATESPATALLPATLQRSSSRSWI